MVRVGVDIGGTFTDIYLMGDEVESSHKVSSTPNDPSEGAIRGIRELLQRTETDPGTVENVLHGTTVATNAIIEDEGAETGMVTTEGFRDVVHIGRHERPENYSIQQEIPWQDRPLAKRRFRETVPERVGPDGDVVEPLDESAVREAAERLRDAGVDSVAICFLFSFVNDAHEERAREIVEDVHPSAYVTTSSEVSSQFREFERFTTTLLNASVGPTVVDYLDRFDRSLSELGIDAHLNVMQSNGGTATMQSVRSQPVMLAYSGPAAGIHGGRRRLQLNASSPDADTSAVTLDMGGTSADIGIVDDGDIVKANVRNTEIGDYPVVVPMVDVETIGAGGGSIAYVDDGGAFRVGPKSAGAEPGPVCYGRGGTEPTVTDAHVALGRVHDNFFLGGKMSLDAEAATAAVESLAEVLDTTPVETARGILELVNNDMANAIRAKTVQRGFDPSEFSLVTFGGAGPLHAAHVAHKLDFDRVVVPRFPGVLSAVGVCTTDLRYEFTQTRFSLLEVCDHDSLVDDYAGLAAEAHDQFDDDGVPMDERTLIRLVDCRYEGQGYELTIPVADGEDVLPPATVRERFDARHQEEFGHAFPGNPVELVTERVVATAGMDSFSHDRFPEATTPVADHVVDTRPVHFTVNDEHAEARFVDRSGLRYGHSFEGPAVVVDDNSTTVVPPGFQANVLAYGDLELTEVMT
jgi:N-methylhydantoinase A